MKDEEKPPELEYCATCTQMTNHRDGECLKHSKDILQVLQERCDETENEGGRVLIEWYRDKIKEVT